MISYSEMDLKQIVWNKLGDPIWVSLIKDYRTFLIRNSKVVTIPIDLKTRYGSEPIVLLKKLNISNDTIPIVLIANNISMSIGIEDCTDTLYIPHKIAIQNIQEAYSSLKNNN